MTTIHSGLARLMADLTEAVDAVIDKPEHKGVIDTWGPISVEVSTVDGLTARFYEEGIEFYPESKS